MLFSPTIRDWGAYNRGMVGWSFSLGKVFGVDVRLHAFFVFLLFGSMAWAASEQRPMMRGVALWFLLLLALVVRESARGMVAGWFGIDVKSVLLLPTGGIQVYGSAEALARSGEPKVQRWMALTGPLASALFGATIAGVILTVSPQVNLWQTLWVTPDHLLRTMVWVNLLLAAVNLLPAWPLDAGRVVRGEIARAPGGAASVLGGLRTFTRVGPAIAVGLIVAGMMFPTLPNFWLMMGGVAILLGAQIERQGLMLQPDSDVVKVGDVMLTEYSILSASATLEDAMEQARHTLQDVFPVVRGGNMVGAVARQNILEALESTGNGYVQGIMTKAFQVAAPGDSLIQTLNKVTNVSGASSQLVPVVDGERVVGIITPQNLQRSMGMLTRKLTRGERRQSEDETE
jgi:Zn-dependent protease/predicted transcriptional regulator